MCHKQSSLSVLGQECFQRHNILLSTRDYVWLFYVLMMCPYMGKLIDKRKSLDKCCLKIGYHTALTVIYLSYLRWMALEMDDNDDRQSSDGAETAQSQESESQSNQLGITLVSEHEVIDEVRAM